MKQFLKRNWAVLGRSIVFVAICWLVVGGSFNIIAICLFFIFIGTELDAIVQRHHTERLDLLEEKSKLLSDTLHLIRRRLKQ
ncbi:MAG: hypothetical protein JRJ39_00515 [Deltaproteobacteria bacterium]|nr:hypothetical protein [Deltaproteobacteria bacterium]MBW1845592.1 hypothetical protein [Deltaproteobacteria bacterium]MBW2032020.1 hypothetical protein [Deltaproteobacteria bacterium]